MGLGYTFRDGDWARLRQIIQKMASINFGPDSAPIFSGLTLTGLTGSRLISTDASNLLTSTDLFSWVTGTTNRVTVADDGDGTITLSGPQDIHTGASPTFAGVNIGNYLVSVDSQTFVYYQNQTSGANSQFRLYSKDGDGTDLVSIQIKGIGLPATATVSELMAIGWDSTLSRYRINTTFSGAGMVLRPLAFFTGTNSNQLVLDTDGQIGINLATPAYQLDIAGTLHTTGQATFEAGLDVPDYNAPVLIGQSAEIEIVHDGTNGQLSNALGQLIIESTDDPVQINSLYFGSMYLDNADFDVVIAALDTYVEVDGGFTAGALSGVTFPDDHYLLVGVAGKYLITYSMSVLTESVANKTVESAIMVNGTRNAQGSSHAEVSPGGSNRPETVNGTAILSLAANDQVSLALANHDDATDLVVNHGSLTLLRVGA